MFVPHRGDHEGAAHFAQRRCDNSKVRGNIVPMERPGDAEGLVSFGDNARHLGKGTLVHHLPPKSQWQKVGWICEKLSYEISKVTSWPKFGGSDEKNKLIFTINARSAFCQCLPNAPLMFTIDPQFYTFCSDPCDVGCLACVVPSVLVTHRGDHQGAASAAKRCGHNAQICRQSVPMEGPPDAQRLIAFRDDARDLGKATLIEHTLSKGQRQDDRWN